MNPGFSEFLRASPEDRRDVFLGTARRLGTPEQNVEKDFWVTAVYLVTCVRTRRGLHA